MNNSKYIRQISLPQVGNQGQQKLSQARVLVVGAGGLGNAVLPYLASMGIGTIGVIDGDRIALSNLHRQVLFSENDIEQSKAEVAVNKLKVQFPEVSFTAYNKFLTAENALQLFRQYDVVVDATDAIKVRYIINDASVLTKTPFVHASVYRFQFQVATFNVNGSGTYRCMYPNPPKTVQSCAEAGVMPTTVAMAGLYQANEVLKYTLQIGDLLTNKVLLVDTLTNTQHQFKYKTKETPIVTETFFYNEHKVQNIEYVSFIEAKQKNGLFLDVRNADETPKLDFENYRQIPLQQLEDNLKSIPKSQPIFVFCQSGTRSKEAYNILKENYDAYCLSDNAPEIKTYEKKENSIY